MDADPPRPQPPPSWDSWAPYGWDSGAAGQDTHSGYTTWSYPPWAEPAPPPQTPRSIRRWMVAIVLIAVVVVGGFTGVAVSLWRSTVTPAAGSSSGSVSGSVEQVDHAVVDITSRLADGSGVAAGTGMVISPGGEVLTNNHVVRGGARI